MKPTMRAQPGLSRGIRATGVLSTGGRRQPAPTAVRAGMIAAAALGLAACDEGIRLPFGQTASASAPTIARAAATAPASGDVEAPEVFAATAPGLWDGRPSLGGVWVAHPDVSDPERARITNTETGQSVVGALFRRERENPGPELMVSSDLAAAIGVIAGQPTELSVVALRPAPEPEPLDLAVPPPPAEDIAEPETEDAVPAAAATAAAAGGVIPAGISAQPLDAGDPIAAASAAIDAAETAMPEPETRERPQPSLSAAAIAADLAEPAVGEAADTPAPQAASAPAATSLERPYIQAGLFSAEANAETAADELREAGVVPTVRGGGSAWRVLVGPARDSAERAALLEVVRGLGYEDAYLVTD